MTVVYQNSHLPPFDEKAAKAGCPICEIDSDIPMYYVTGPDHRGVVTVCLAETDAIEHHHANDLRMKVK
jgi:hypothetical protein